MHGRGIFSVFEFFRDPRHQGKVMKEIKGQNLQRKALSYSHLKIQLEPLLPTPPPPQKNPNKPKPNHPTTAAKQKEPGVAVEECWNHSS